MKKTLLLLVILLPMFLMHGIASAQVQSSIPAFKEVAVIPSPQKNAPAIITLFVDKNAREFGDFKDAVRDDVFKDKKGETYRNYAEQVRDSKKRPLLDVAIDASQSAPGGVRNPGIPGTGNIRIDQGGFDGVQNARDQMNILDLRYGFIDSGGVMGFPKGIQDLSQNVRGALLAKFSQNPRIHKEPIFDGYRVILIDDILDVMLDESLFPARIVKVGLTEGGRAAAVSYIFFRIDESKQQISINLDLLKKHLDAIPEKTRKGEKEAIKIVLQKVFAYDVQFDGAFQKVADRRTVMQISFPYHILTRGTLYIGSDWFTRKEHIDAARDHAVAFIKKRSKDSAKPIPDSAIKKEIPLELLKILAAGLYQNYRYWIFVEVFQGSIDPKTLSEDFKRFDKVFLETLGEVYVEK